jgi:hypothetical protein
MAITILKLAQGWFIILNRIQRIVSSFRTDPALFNSIFYRMFLIIYENLEGPTFSQHQRMRSPGCLHKAQNALEEKCVVYEEQLQRHCEHTLACDLISESSLCLGNIHFWVQLTRGTILYLMSWLAMFLPSIQDGIYDLIAGCAVLMLAGKVLQ